MEVTRTNKFRKNRQRGPWGLQLGAPSANARDFMGLGPELALARWSLEGSHSEFHKSGCETMPSTSNHNIPSTVFTWDCSWLP